MTSRIAFALTTVSVLATSAAAFAQGAPAQPAPTQGAPAQPAPGGSGTAAPPLPPPSTQPAPPPPPPGYGQPPPPGYQQPPPGYQQPPPGYYPPPPGYAYGYPPPPGYGYAPPPERRGVRTHDGFYLRMALGIGVLRDSETVTGTGNSYSATISGTALATEFAIGGTLANGFVLGGAIQSASAPSPSYKVSGQTSTASPDVTVQASAIGLFADVYPNPKAGFHIEGLLGFGVLHAESNKNGSSSSSKDPSGLALAIGVGHEWWVGEEWSLGVLGRLQYMSLKYDSGNGLVDKNSVTIPALLMTLTYH